MFHLLGNVIHLPRPEVIRKCTIFEIRYVDRIEVTLACQ